MIARRMSGAMTIALIAICSVTTTTLARAQDGADPARVARVLHEAEAIQKQVAELRGLPFLAEVEKGVKTEAELRAFILEEFEKEAPAEEFEAQQRALVRLGLIPDGFDLRHRMIDLYSEQIGGFYNHDTKRLYLIARGKAGDEESALNDSFVMAHELHHALQDQHFDLGAQFRILNDHEDRIMAHKALVEGEATLVGFKYMFEVKLGLKKLPDLGVLMRMNKTMSESMPQGEALKSMPDYIKEGLMFPYEAGAAFVQKIYDTYGWERVTALFADPPQSTEQILHPEKYLGARDEPVTVRLPDLESAFEGEVEELLATCLGEYNIGIVLRQAYSARRAAAIAAGWDGDSFTVLEPSAGGGPVLVWLTTWDSPAEADEFFASYQKVLAKKYATPREVSNGLVSAGKAGDVALLERNGKASVLVLEGARDQTQAQALRDMAWGAVLVHERLEGLGELEQRSLAAPASPARPKPEVEPAPTLRRPAPTYQDPETGFTFGLPGAGWKQEEESIQQLSAYTRARFVGPDGNAVARFMDIPVPFDPETLLDETEGYAKQLIPGYKRLGHSETELAGREAFVLEFEGVLPEFEDGTTHVRAVCIENDGWTVLLLLSAPSESWEAARAGFERLLWTARFVPVPEADAEAPLEPSFTVPDGFEPRDPASPHVKVEYRDAEGAVIQVIETPAGDADLERTVRMAEAQLKRVLSGYRHIGSRRLTLADGAGVLLEYEADLDGSPTRYRQVVSIIDGTRRMVSCFCKVEDYERKQRAFDEVLRSLGAKLESPPARSPRKKGRLY